MSHKAAAAVTATVANVPTASLTATTDAKGEETYDASMMPPDKTNVTVNTEA